MRERVEPMHGQDKGEGSSNSRNQSVGGNPSWNLVVQSVLEAWKEWQHREPMDQTELWVEESDGDDTRIRLLEVGTGDVGDGMMEGGAQVNVDKTYGRLQSR